MLALKDSDRNTAVSMKAKKALVRRSAFPKLQPNSIEPLVSSYGLLYIKVIEEVVAQALMIQVATKASGPNTINFQILRMIWSWEKIQITSIIYHTI